MFEENLEGDDTALDKIQFAEMMKKVGVNFDKAQLETTMMILDADRSGAIEFNEFLSWWYSENSSVGDPFSSKQGGGAGLGGKLTITIHKAKEIIANEARTMFGELVVACVRVVAPGSPR